ncbi:hypothetical protein [Streptomyces sp. WAC01280]|uniref:hypothetical protein n=1 Tax=Streptomyces sp. WAC01280 TaxID=2487424 RepID=UPI000F77F60C|nr:hypothetical protein [Streptomyces sp. WAC01280]RSS57471.1 hypothetical protein EF909_16140 [Streptomyces sp. WAC01280]
MTKRTWVAAGAAALTLGLSVTAYYVLAAGTVTTSAVCVPPTSKPEYLAAYANTVVIGTITDPARYVPDASDPNTGVAVSTLHIEKTLKGTASGSLTVAQSVARTSTGTYTTREQLYQPLTQDGRYAVAVLDTMQEGGRWVWGAEAATSPAGDDRWTAAVANAHLPEITCDDTITETTAPQ